MKKDKPKPLLTKSGIRKKRSLTEAQKKIARENGKLGGKFGHLGAKFGHLGSKFGYLGPIARKKYAAEANSQRAVQEERTSEKS